LARKRETFPEKGYAAFGKKKLYRGKQAFSRRTGSIYYRPGVSSLGKGQVFSRKETVYRDDRAANRSGGVFFWSQGVDTRGKPSDFFGDGNVPRRKCPQKRRSCVGTEGARNSEKSLPVFLTDLGTRITGCHFASERKRDSSP
jgi:hypothetical protein